MALMNCGECKKEISTDAPNCLGCGAPVKRAPDTKVTAHKTRMGFKVLGYSLIALFVFSIISQVSKNSEKEADQANKRIENSASAADHDRAPATIARTHHYSLIDDGEYGYEGALSDDDKNRGVATKPILMARFLGEQNGVYSVQVSAGSARQVFSCSTPCDFIKIKAYFQGQIIKSENFKNTHDSVLSAVMEDAIAGELEPYIAKRSRSTE